MNMEKRMCRWIKRWHSSLIMNEYFALTEEIVEIGGGCAEGDKNNRPQKGSSTKR